MALAQQFNESQLRLLLRDCIKGLSYLHENGIIHRDIKPQNIFFDKNFCAKLGDFGVSSICQCESNDKISHFSGTYAFQAPEIHEMSQKKTNECSGKKADV
eukprot:TRINITY_DN3357_c0_g1_i2.p3 TRINITY_DN3357_c0_g1~~TRINITY_DN3357_c0_g1_i2.p3  ORF type:complete len:101 (-),score=11.62 TRINITY_DN3357_c0_g1_i2:874-1176(-)